MKVWSAIFNFIAVWVIVIMLGVFYNHIDVIQTDYDTAVLRQVIEYAGEAAFNTAVVQNGDIDMDYTKLGNVSLNPSESLKVFEDIVCLSYGMSISDENRAHIESYIPSAIMCAYDGYYITQLMDDNIAELQWSVKIPYTMQASKIVGGLKRDYTVALRIDSEGIIVIDNNTPNGLVERYKEYGLGIEGAGFANSVLNKDIVRAKINTTITDALSYSIAKVSEYRGGKNYRVYLPADTTFSGINTINGPSLIILLNGGDFAGKAKVSEAAISGFKVIARNWVVGFTDHTGKKWYCYESQLTEGLVNSGGIVVNDKPFSTVGEAAEKGYYPHYEYISLPFNND